MFKLVEKGFLILISMCGLHLSIAQIWNQLTSLAGIISGWGKSNGEKWHHKIGDLCFPTFLL